ncbi:MAG: beta-N-acetylhexosaminidase [Spirochaetota bacterium]
MHALVPYPRQATLKQSLFEHTGPLRAHGPSWVRTVLEELATTPLYPRLTPSDSGPVRIEAPEAVPLVPDDLPNASYTLDVTNDGIVITCGEPAGLVAALRTLAGLSVENGYTCATISDSPAFPYRGMHLDVCRHFFDVAFVERYIDVIAAAGMNVFHWHLTEDQGWRMPIDSWPRLNEVGSWRTADDGSRYGGHYTKDEIRRVVRFAGARGVLVVPEIELPGHARAAIASYPELSCEEKQIDVWNRWGICEDVFCAGDERVFAFVEDVFREVVELFPSRYIHLGGDECPKTRWKSCPKCQERIRTEGLRDEDELQSYFVGRAATMLERLGRTAVGWDEILEGGLPEGTVVMSWRGTEGGAKAASMDHDVIMSPTSHCYFDYRQVDRDDAPGFPFKDADGAYRVLPITQVYTFDPTEGLPASDAEHVIGGQANLWTEQLPTEELAEQMLMPRLLAIAEALWTAPAQRDFDEFANRARGARDRFARAGWSIAEVPELEL